MGPHVLIGPSPEGAQGALCGDSPQIQAHDGLKRVDDWPERLARFVADRARAAFAWGAHDCCTFALRSVEEITGVDLLPGRRWRTAAGAARAIRKLGRAGAPGGGGIEAAAVAIAAAHAAPEVPVLEARRGDVVLAAVPTAAGAPGVGGNPPEETRLEDALGVAEIGHALFAGAGGGLVRLPLAACRRAWRVG